jgi:hypothetical protein
LESVLAVGIDSTIEEFHARLNPFGANKQSAHKKTEEETTQ